MKFGKRKRLENVGDDTKTLKILGKGKQSDEKCMDMNQDKLGEKQGSKIKGKQSDEKRKQTNEEEKSPGQEESQGE